MHYIFLVKVLAFLFMLEVRDEALNGLNDLCLGEVLLLEDVLQLPKESIYLVHRVAGSLFYYTQRGEPLHINLLARHIELLIRLFTSSV